MRRLVLVVGCFLALGGCQTLVEGSGSGTVTETVTAGVAAAIAGDMADRLSERLSPAGQVRLLGAASEFGQALAVSLKASGYAVIDGGSAGEKATELSFTLDRSEVGLLASLSTKRLRLARLYAVTGSGAAPASPLSVMTFN